jgi:hypothetical protein
MKPIAIAGALLLVGLNGCASLAPPARPSGSPTRPVTSLSSDPAAASSAAPSSDILTPAAGGVISTPDEAVARAEGLTTIVGPWSVGDVEHGKYESLWQGSSNDLSGQGTAARATLRLVVVWRVNLSGPSGSEQLYIDERNGHLVDAITQGS